MRIKKIQTPIKDLFVVTIDYLSDKRGYFMESWHKENFAKEGLNLKLVQENQSRSKKSVLRGLHFQDLTAPMEKIVRCVYGEIFDVAVDLRINSETFSRWFGIRLSSKNKKQLFVPVGFAHGFVVLSNFADVIYKQTAYYTPSAERTILWSDTDIAINWPIENPILSKKDTSGKTLKEYLKNPTFT